MSKNSNLEVDKVEQEKNEYNLMKYFIGVLSIILFVALTVVGYVKVQEGKKEVRPIVSEKSKACMECHTRKGLSAGTIRDWKMSKHAAKGIGCNECHIPVEGTPERIVSMKSACEDKEVRREVSARNCKKCHEKKVEEFSKGKHAYAWSALESQPATHKQPWQIMEGEKGCGGCHKIGRDEGQCDSCHTRHKFSAAEARKPEACATCHMGFDHPQWEMYNTSKHGVVYQTEKHNYDFDKKISDWYKEPYEASSKTPRAPVCVTCHMEEGNHEVRTSWGFLALRVPEDDPEWAKDRAIIMRGLGVRLDTPEGKERLTEMVVANDMVRLTKEAWQKERDKMIKVCGQCHGESWGKDELDKVDGIIKEADKLMAEAVLIVEGLYKDNIIKAPKSFPNSVDMLRYYDADYEIEQKLYFMFLEHRMRTFQGAFHSNPDYMHWYGWAEMKRSLSEIREEAGKLRAEHKK